MNWTGCDLVEIDPDKVGGQPVVKGTRVPAEVVPIDEEYGRMRIPGEAERRSGMKPNAIPGSLRT